MMDTDLERGSQVDLSPLRVTSSIPRAAPDDSQSSCPASNDQSVTWMYPSEQMFYKAMERKGAQPKAEDMQLVVNIHNMVNEQCWVEVLKWEAQHKAY